jgi:general secretion pathway protein G
MGDSMLVKTAAVNSTNSSAPALPEAKAISKQQGFSLIEILVVLVIMGLLISIIAPNVLGRADEARVQKVFADFSAIETALRMYRLDNYAYPSREPVPANWKQDGYLEALPVDPWGNPYRYLSPGQNGQYDIFTFGADGTRGGEGQNADYGNWQNQEQ